ncbi:unnamed protein product [Hermetia illucens]|uniref:Uncharacterized protein n=1 Tax=Hermetia illucens TaxID=343691 RepID=A0A7R8UE51_HERIL|nr:unnamed protein product [Hermetia illucens]
MEGFDVTPVYHSGRPKSGYVIAASHGLVLGITWTSQNARKWAPERFNRKAEKIQRLNTEFIYMTFQRIKPEIRV